MSLENPLEVAYVATQKNTKTLIDTLCDEPESYDFSQAIRILNAYNRYQTQRNELIPHYDASPMPDGDSAEICSAHKDLDGIHLSIAMAALSGVEGVIPDYIYEELLSSLHQEETGLKAFLAIFNHRSYEITYTLQTQRWLLLQQEQQHQLYERLAQLAGLPAHAKALFRYTLLFGQNSRNLSTLKQILNDYFDLKIDVSAVHSEKRKLPLNAQSTIGRKQNRQHNNALGQGLLLGSQCDVPNAGIQVYIEPTDKIQVKQLRVDHQLAYAVKSVVRHYLKDDTPVLVYLLILRKHLGSPLLSCHQLNAARLGEVDCLAPERFPEKKVKIRLR